MNNIYIRETNTFSIKVKAMTAKDKNGDYNVYVHSDLSEEAKYEALRHEQEHITQKHFDSNKSAIECENEVINYFK